LSVPGAGQGEIWECQLDPIEGHEQAGRRPCLVISVDHFGKGAADLSIVVPITRTSRTSFELRLDPPEGGLTSVSYALPYQVRTISRTRLISRWGVVKDDTLREIIKRVRILIRPPDR